MGNNLVCKDGKHDWDTRIMRLNGKQEEYHVCKNCGTTEHVDSNESCKNHTYGTTSLKKYSKDKIYEIEYRQCTKCSDTVVINTKQIKCYGNNHIGKLEIQSKTENCKKYVWLECKSCHEHIGETNFPYHNRIGIKVGSDEKCNQYKYAFCKDCNKQIGTKEFTNKKSHQRSEIKYETIDCIRYSYRDCTRCGDHEIFGKKPLKVDHERIENTYAYSGCTQYKVQKCTKCGTITKWLNKTGNYNHIPSEKKTAIDKKYRKCQVYEYQNCTRCNTKEIYGRQYTKEIMHTNGAWKTDVNNKCQEYNYRICSVCGNTTETKLTGNYIHRSDNQNHEWVDNKCNLYYYHNCVRCNKKAFDGYHLQIGQKRHVRGNRIDDKVTFKGYVASYYKQYTCKYGGETITDSTPYKTRDLNDW